MKYATVVSDSFTRQYEHKSVPWGPLGYVTYKRTYSRAVNGRTEEWWETIRRCCNGLLDIGAPYTQDEIQELYDHIFHLRCSPAGRPLWQLGTELVRRNGADSLVNCWTTIVDNPIEPFCFAFNELMLGGGVGFVISRRHVYEMPHVRFTPTISLKHNSDVDFIVPDNREGWVELMRRVLERFFYPCRGLDGQNFSYSTHCIRNHGERIKSFGGTASGPNSLSEGVENITKVISARYGEKLRPVDCLDIANIIGSIVVAGNVRRSAEICIGDHDDKAYLSAKRWDLGGVPNWRSMSNNSVDCVEIDDLPEDSFWGGYQGNGEPYGLVNLRNARGFGRLRDGFRKWVDPTVVGFNPCGEIGLANCENCNLSDLFTPNLKDRQQFGRVAALLYRANKAISCYPYSYLKTQEIVEQNRRLGIGVTGCLQSSFGPDDYDSVYRHLCEEDKRWSREMRSRESVKVSTVKPSGTLSLLAGCTPGVHPAYSRQYIRRIRFAVDDPLVTACRDSGNHVEHVRKFDGSDDETTVVVSFPVKVPDSAKIAEDVDAITQLEYQKMLQTHWADNAVSVTVYYKDHELPVIRQWLSENYAESVKSVSFLRHSEHGFDQAPYEPISAAQYAEMASRVKPIERIHVTSVDIGEDEECVGGACPVR